MVGVDGLGLVVCFVMEVRLGARKERVSVTNEIWRWSEERRSRTWMSNAAFSVGNKGVAED